MFPNYLRNKFHGILPRKSLKGFGGNLLLVRLGFWGEIPLQIILSSCISTVRGSGRGFPGPHNERGGGHFHSYCYCRVNFLQVKVSLSFLHKSFFYSHFKRKTCLPYSSVFASSFIQPSTFFSLRVLFHPAIHIF